MTTSSPLDAVRSALAEAGVDPSDVGIVLTPEDVGRYNESDTWILTPGEGQRWLVGGVERNQLSLYDDYETLGLAANALHHLLTRPVEKLDLGPADAKAAYAAAAALTKRIRAAWEPEHAGPVLVALQPGDMIDLFGHESAQGTFVFGTPLQQPWPRPRSCWPTTSTGFAIPLIATSSQGQWSRGSVSPVAASRSSCLEAPAGSRRWVP